MLKLFDYPGILVPKEVVQVFSTSTYVKVKTDNVNYRSDFYTDRKICLPDRIFKSKQLFLTILVVNPMVS